MERTYAIGLLTRFIQMHGQQRHMEALRVLIGEVADSHRWYVIRSVGGKFADGYYGWDGTVHSVEQIFPGDHLPYSDLKRMPVSGLGSIVGETVAYEVGQGLMPPAPETVRRMFE